MKTLHIIAGIIFIALNTASQYALASDIGPLECEGTFEVTHTHTKCPETGCPITGKKIKFKVKLNYDDVSNVMIGESGDTRKTWWIAKWNRESAQQTFGFYENATGVNNGKPQGGKAKQIGKMTVTFSKQGDYFDGTFEDTVHGHSGYINQAVKMQ